MCACMCNTPYPMCVEARSQPQGWFFSQRRSGFLTGLTGRVGWLLVSPSPPPWLQAPTDPFTYCLCACVLCAHATVPRWKSGDNFWESVLFYLCVLEIEFRLTGSMAGSFNCWAILLATGHPHTWVHMHAWQTLSWLVHLPSPWSLLSSVAYLSLGTLFCFSSAVELNLELGHAKPGATPLKCILLLVFSV